MTPVTPPQAGLARAADPAEALLAALSQDLADGVACEAPWHGKDSTEPSSWMAYVQCPRCRAEGVMAACDPCVQVIHQNRTSQHRACRYVGPASSWIVRITRFRGGP